MEASRFSSAVINALISRMLCFPAGKEIWLRLRRKSLLVLVRLQIKRAAINKAFYSLYDSKYVKHLVISDTRNEMEYYK